ncbi:GTPase ObgE [Mycoplasma zalophi]|uniref:GTPase Obg n=1 Tax=Mycoplasma zalophi TaxID=191287 RepID=A0ABS6DQ52_9MOLU|nr:GTPase ObgE [Mycoplasma zalophi]MBU4690734.1 GTPase ObgE [Mycoplasma zalophi]MBU4692450.1 GTPase ObgE [Mycoplasma zalophi]
MKFIDEVKITVKAGNGGNGLISFRREAHVDRGGPDGGDGGKGGDIYFVGDSGINTLLNFHYKNKITAQDGENGKRKNAYGANGQDTYIKVPLGTLVYNYDNLIADIIDSKPYLIAKGGRGGRGNVKFKTSRNTAPRLSENGELGENLDIKLSLKVLADVGLIGKPSAGKSTLLSQISNAKPKIAEYEFTTLVPQLGLVKYYDDSFVITDLPGLINGASEGKGLGIQFLKHIERCKILCHVIDFGSEEKNPIQDFEDINNELIKYNIKLENRPQVIIANKSDLKAFNDHKQLFKEKYPNIKLIDHSLETSENTINSIKKEIYETLKEAENILINEVSKNEVTITLEEDDFEIIRVSFDTYEIKGKKIKELYNRIPLISYDNLMRFNNKLKHLGVWEELLKKGIVAGDTVRIENYEFTWDNEN